MSEDSGEEGQFGKGWVDALGVRRRSGAKHLSWPSASTMSPPVTAQTCYRPRGQLKLQLSPPYNLANVTCILGAEYSFREQGPQLMGDERGAGWDRTLMDSAISPS